jgi:hypothetical protein
MGRNINQRAYSVGGEDDVGGLQETSAEHISKGVIFLVEGENTSRGQA